MPRAVSREPSGAGLVSRAGLVHGTARGHNDMWYDLDTFLLDQVCEVLDKLEEGNLDDAIWGKIVIMEKCKRVAKAYLRKTTIIVDGSEDEFDGSTLGFNCFDNTYRDENTEEIRQKIGDGVILKVDYQGNIKGMARGTTPVICLGFKDSERRKNCISDRLARLQGRLNTNEEDKAFKIFDMRRFKSALDREISDGQPDAKNLLLKTTVRVALVKDGGDMNRTPCWFTVINLIALDTLKSRIPNIKNMSLMNRSHSEAAYSSLPTLVAPTPIYNQPANSIQINQQETYGTNPNGSPNDPTQALTQLIAAAVKQANGQTISQSLHNLPVSVDQLATLASSLSLGKQEISQQILAPQVGIKGDRKDRRRNYKVPSADDSSGEDSALRSDSTQGECQPRSRNKRWDQTTKSIDAVAVLGGGSNVPNGSTSTCANSLVASRSRSPDSKRRGPPRPRLQDVMFDRSYSTTSDYDSNRELFDSGSWSSNGSNCYQGRSPASSVVSDSEGHARLAKPKQIEGHNGKLVQLRQAPPPQRAIKEVPLSRQQVVRKELHRQTSTNFNRLPSITASAPKAEIYEHEKEKDERKDRTLDHPSDRSSKPRLTYRLSGVNVPTPTTKPPPPPHEYDEPEVTDEMISIVPVPATNHDQASTSMKDADSIPLHATIVSTDDEEINTLPPPKPPSPDYTDARRQTATITVSEGCRSVEGRLWEKQRPSTGSQRATSFVGELRRVLLKRNSFKEQQNAEQNNNKPSSKESQSTKKSSSPSRLPTSNNPKSQSGKRGNQSGRPPLPPTSNREETRPEPLTITMSRPATAVPPASNRYENESVECGTLSYAEERKRSQGLRRTHAINSTQSVRSASSISHHGGAPFTEQFSASATGHYSRGPAVRRAALCGPQGPLPRVPSSCGPSPTRSTNAPQRPPSTQLTHSHNSVNGPASMSSISPMSTFQRTSNSASLLHLPPSAPSTRGTRLQPTYFHSTQSQQQLPARAVPQMLHHSGSWSVPVWDHHGMGVWGGEGRSDGRQGGQGDSTFNHRVPLHHSTNSAPLKHF